MKKMRLGFFLFGAAMIGLLSCKDDDAKKTPETKFVMGDNEVKIDRGYFIIDLSVGHDDSGDEYYRNELVFTNGVTLTQGTENLIPSGTGMIISLLLNGDSQELKSGTYTWQSEENEQPFDFWSGIITDGYGTENEVQYRFTEGEIVVKVSGDTFTITGEGVIHKAIYYEDEKDWGLADMTSEALAGTIKFEGKLTELENDF